MADLKIKNVDKYYDGLQVIHGVNVHVEDGEFVVLVGPSGCGKSTLLRMIAGLEEIDRGQIFIDNQVVNHVDAADRGIAMVFQSYALYPHMSVEENMGFGLKMMKMDKHLIKERIDNAAKILQLESFLNRKPKNLSGGQRQRVAIGRAIVREPKIFLFDEPLSNLDAELRVQMRVELAILHKQLKATMVYVTHDQVEAMTLADRIVILNAGRIEQIGSPLDLYHHPDNLFVAGFLGSPRMNFIPVKVVKSQGKGLTVSLFGDRELQLPHSSQMLNTGDQLTLGIRPEHFGQNEEGSISFHIEVDVAENLGGIVYLYGTYRKSQLIVQIEGNQSVARGDQYCVNISANSCYLFDSRGKAVGAIT